MTYRIAVRGCQHLGYAMRGMRLNRTTGWNQRVVDGHTAHLLTMERMLTAGVDGILDGGDLYHWNKPVPRDVDAANKVDSLRTEAGLWLVGNSGNHDAGGGLDTSAAAVLHRPALGAHIVYPDLTRPVGDGVGPFPGLYEVHSPVDGVAVHVVSHYGLSRSLAETGINIDPQPIEGYVNILTSHGMLEVDDTWLHSLNEHGEERPVPTEWLDRGWDAAVFSHVHQQYRVDYGPAHATRGQVWWTGSSLRRGFSDEPSPRGWLEVVIEDNGQVRIEPHTIWQRPQFDLPPIDAAALTVSQVNDLIEANIDQATLHDNESEALTGDGGAIVRQRVVGAPAGVRQGLAAQAHRYATLTAPAAFWRVAFDHAPTPGALPGQSPAPSVTHRVTDVSGALAERAPRLMDALGTPDDLRPQVLAAATTYTDAAAPTTDSDDTNTEA